MPHFFFSILEQICLICNLKSLLRVFPCRSSLPTLSRFHLQLHSKQFNKDSYILEAKVEERYYESYLRNRS